MARLLGAGFPGVGFPGAHLRPLEGADALNATLREWARTRFAWGTADCLLSVVRYVADAKRLPMPKWPQYSSGAGALRILQRHGGLEAYADKRLGELGCKRTQWPVRGDVGLIDLPGSGPTACLCTGAKWAARGFDQLVIVDMAPEAAWAVIADDAQSLWATSTGRHQCQVQ